jgi:hypothetical protein
LEPALYALNTHEIFPYDIDIYPFVKQMQAQHETMMPNLDPIITHTVTKKAERQMQYESLTLEELRKGISVGVKNITRDRKNDLFALFD